MTKRQQELLEIIKEKTSVNVQELFPLFDVSTATIRKDLAALEEANLIFRKRGEAHITRTSELTAFEARCEIHKRAKQLIAAEAVKFIEDGDSIILDSGTTTIEIAKLLVDRKNLSVLTNSIPVANILANTEVSVSLSGGILFSKNMSTQGPDAEAFFRKVAVNKAFIAASGVQPDIGMASLSLFEATLKMCMIESSKTVFAVIDSSKFSNSGINLFAEFSKLDYIITEKPLTDRKLTERLAQEGVTCIVVD